MTMPAPRGRGEDGVWKVPEQAWHVVNTTQGQAHRRHGGSPGSGGTASRELPPTPRTGLPLVGVQRPLALIVAALCARPEPVGR